MSNIGVDDIAEVLERERVCVALRAFDETLTAGLALMLTAAPSTAARYEAAAQKHFSLDEDVTKVLGYL